MYWLMWPRNAWVDSGFRSDFIRGSNEIPKTRFFSFSVGFVLKRVLPFRPQDGGPQLLGWSVSLFSSSGRKEDSFLDGSAKDLEWSPLLAWLESYTFLDQYCVEGMGQNDYLGDLEGTVGKVDRVVQQGWYLQTSRMRYTEPSAFPST